MVKSKDAERRERRERRERAPSAARGRLGRRAHTHTADVDAHVPRASIEEIKTILTRLEELLCDVRDTISQPSENNDADPIGANTERNRRTVTTQTLMEEITATTTSMTTTTSSLRDASTNTRRTLKY